MLWVGATGSVPRTRCQSTKFSYGNGAYTPDAEATDQAIARPLDDLYLEAETAQLRIISH